VQIIDHETTLFYTKSFKINITIYFCDLLYSPGGGVCGRGSATKTKTSRPAIAGKPRCSVYKLWQI